MEDVLPPWTQAGAGFEPARVRQLTVFLENRVGRLQQLVRAYEEHRGRIVALSIQNSADTALVRIICADPDLAREMLEAEGFSFSEQAVLVVELPRDTRQPMIELCAALLACEINIHYAYPLLCPPGGPALALYVDDHVMATQVLMRKQFRLIGESDLAK